MSAQFQPAEQERSPKEIPQPSEAYRRAYRSCFVTSALLWRAIDVTPITNGKLELEPKVPKAVPVTLIFAALCCAYKMVIEWSQCESEKNKFATLDYNVVRSFAFGAILVSVVQYLTQLQIGDFWTERFYSSEQGATLEQILFIAIALFVCASITRLREWKDVGWLKRIITVLSILVSLYLCLVLRRVVAGSQGYLMVALALAIGAFLVLCPKFVLSRIQNTAAENGRYSVAH